MCGGGVGQLSRLVHLQNLDIEQAEISGTALAVVKNFRELQSLNVGGAKKVNDAGLKNLVGLSQLKRLNLAGTGVSDVGMADVGTLAGLEELSVPESITDAGLARLKGLTG